FGEIEGNVVEIDRPRHLGRHLLRRMAALYDHGNVELDAFRIDWIEVTVVERDRPAIAVDVRTFEAKIAHRDLKLPHGVEAERDIDAEQAADTTRTRRHQGANLIDLNRKDGRPLLVALHLEAGHVDLLDAAFVEHLH